MIFLVRHAPHAHIGRRLSGRMPGLDLTDEGLGLAGRLAERLADKGLEAVQSSPIDRTMQTAWPVARRQGLKVEPVDALTEIDFGAWTGRSFAELADDPDWAFWNERRAEACCPNGESMAAAQRRFVDHLFNAARQRGAIAMISHCDIIRAGVAHVLGLTLDHVHRFEIAPASITELLIEGDRARLVQLNERVH